MLTLVTFVHIITAVFIICVVLLQGGSSGGLGAGFGGGSSDSQSLFGASGPTSLLGKLTYLFAAMFMITSIALTIMQGKRYDTGLKDKLKKASEQTATPVDDNTTQTASDRDTTTNNKKATDASSDNQQ